MVAMMFVPRWGIHVHSSVLPLKATIILVCKMNHRSWVLHIWYVMHICISPPQNGSVGCVIYHKMSVILSRPQWILSFQQWPIRNRTHTRLHIPQLNEHPTITPVYSVFTTKRSVWCSYWNCDGFLQKSLSWRSDTNTNWPCHTWRWIWKWAKWPASHGFIWCRLV